MQSESLARPFGDKLELFVQQFFFLYFKCHRMIAPDEKLDEASR